jgi:hypothetical protein
LTILLNWCERCISRQVHGLPCITACKCHNLCLS